MNTKKKPEQLGQQTRFINFKLLPNFENTKGLVDLEARTMRLPFSSEEPVDRWFGEEVLSHTADAIRIGIRQQTMPLLYNHDRDQLLGIVESIDLGDDKRLYANVRFGRDDLGTWAMDQVQDGILINVSFMYQVYKFITDEEEDIYTAIDWEVYEVSLVTIPADATVGLGRDQPNTNLIDVKIEHLPDKNPQQAVTEPPKGGFFSPETRQQPSASAETTQEGNLDMKVIRHKLQDQATDGIGGSAGASVDINQVRTNVLNEERARTAEITSMCTAHNLPAKFRDELINGGFDIAESRGMVLVELGNRNSQKPLSSLSDEIGLTQKEKNNYSLMRAVNAIVNGSLKSAGFEFEVSQAIAKRNGSDVSHERNFFFPNDLPFAPSEDHVKAFRAANPRLSREMQQRAIYQVGTAEQGGNLVATNLLADSFIEVLRNQTVLSILGATYLDGLVGNVDIPRQISQTGVYWVGESGAITEGEATYDKVSLRPKTITALSKVSRLMLLQSTPAIEMIARRDLMAVGAIEIDRAGLSGSGASNQPTGIVNQSGVGSVVGGTNGANLSFDNLIQLKYATRVANAIRGNEGFALNSKSIGYLSSLKASTGQYLWDPQGGLTANSPDKVKGASYAESQQLRSTLTKGSSSGICSEAIYSSNWDELLIGQWGVTEIAVNPYDSTGFANGDIILRMMQTLDIAVRHGASFSVMSDALTPGF